jgi:hypothetical protein
VIQFGHVQKYNQQYTGTREYDRDEKRIVEMLGIVHFVREKKNYYTIIG